LETYELNFDYTLMNEIMMVVKRFGCIILQNEAQLFCRMVLGIPKENLENCINKIQDLHGVECRKLEQGKK
jgi:hypothetical protein